MSMIGCNKLNNIDSDNQPANSLALEQNKTASFSLL